MNILKGGNVTNCARSRVMAILCILSGSAIPALGAQTVVGVVPVNPAWLKVDSVTKTAEFTLLGGLTPANGGMNFNGATSGSIKLSVPVGWHVVLHFRNSDQTLPHSAEVIAAVATLPLAPSTTPAFPRAATGQLAQGLASGAHEDVKFIADKAGAYFIVCSTPAHATAGMWIRFDVSATLTRPTVTTAKQGAP